MLIVAVTILVAVNAVVFVVARTTSCLFASAARAFFQVDVFEVDLVGF